MAYTELIKSFSRIRNYMRDFYVYGFKSRTEYQEKSVRSYDNERRRLESWLGDYMSFRQTASGKRVFLSFDSRNTTRNPLYKAFKAKSFTDGDITLHFILFDILYAPEISMALPAILQTMDQEYLSHFQTPMVFDESTVRKKLKEYVSLGLLQCKKHGKQTVYHRSADTDITGWQDAVSYFSEVGMVGVIGNYLLDRTGAQKDMFRFKHHYITHALESDVLYALLVAMGEKRAVTIRKYSNKADAPKERAVVPLRIFISVQSGRRYLMAWNRQKNKLVSYRLDHIISVAVGEAEPDFDAIRGCLNEKQKHMWGVVRDSGGTSKLEHVSFTVHIGDDEAYIWSRLEREKRCGTVTRLDEHTARFDADVYDGKEMIPWIRTFLCRITNIDFSDEAMTEKFKSDFLDMCNLYGVEGGDTRALS